MKTIYTNGNIITLNKTNDIFSAMLVEDGIIKEVSSNIEILSIKDEETKVIDLLGKTIMPSFIDSHGHIVALSQAMMILSLQNCKSVNEIVKALQDKYDTSKFEKDDWLLGFSYDNLKLDGKNHPTRSDLDKISTEIPISITHASGHIAVVNTKALELYGYLGENISVPDGGVVRLDENNQPNGILEENAILAPEKKSVIKPQSVESIVESLVKTQQIYASQGFTTAMDASVEIANKYHEILQKAGAEGKLMLDIVGLATMPVTFELLENTGSPKKEYVNNYKLLAGKTWLDGSPQGKTAWISEPYLKVPAGEKSDYNGYGTLSDDKLLEYFKGCIERNLQVHAHTNGDLACEQFLRVYEKSLEETGGNKNLRPVMVHCQTIREDQLDKVKELGIVPTFFNDHVYFWGDDYINDIFGEKRAQNISPIGFALEKGIKFTLHQDPPVKMPNAILAIHNAVNRKTINGTILGEHQKIDVLNAIKAVTKNAAYQNFEEDTKGTIEKEKFADFVILSDNPLTISSENIQDIKVLQTIKRGKTIFS